MELSKAPRLAVTWGCGLGCVGTSALGGGAAGGRGGGGGAGGIDNAPVELRRWSLITPRTSCRRGLRLLGWTGSVLH